MDAVCIADTHNLQERVEMPEGDILLVGGDLTMRGHEAWFESFGKWAANQTEKYDKIFVTPGNHDVRLDEKQNRESVVDKNIDLVAWHDDVIYLDDESVEYKGYKIHGCPWSNQFGNWAFMGIEEVLENIIDLADDDTDILLLHGPPKNHLDATNNVGPNEDPHVGSESFRDWVHEHKPELVVFGHIHEAYGKEKKNGIQYVNASVVNSRYNVVNDPIVIDLEDRDD